MKRLTKKEEEVMQILWKLGKGFVKDIRKRMPPPVPPYNTVSSLVRLLEEKGFVDHTAYGRAHEYFPLITKEAYRASFMGMVVKDYFADSYKSVISMFAREEQISVEELKEIIDMIEANKTETDE